MRDDHGVRAALTALFGAALFGVISSPALAAEPMSPRDVVAAKFAAVNRHSVEDVVAFYAPDAKVTASDFCAPRQGSADIKRTYEGIFAAVPDAKVEVQEYVQQDDRVAVRFTLSSRIPGRSFDVPLQDFFTVRDGLIVRDDGMFDNHGRPCTP